MDCEKFEPLLLDELYDELDELTSAAVKRHVSGCARCGALLGGFRATRRGLSLPLVPVPDRLEERILAAAKEAQKVVPIRSRMSSALSVAGSWAMRPQTAMAAVFLLMIGTSAFVLRSSKRGEPSQDRAVSVTVEGAPAPVASAAQPDSLDDKAAAAAHGPGTPSIVTRPPPSLVAAADEAAGGPLREKSDKADGDGFGFAKDSLAKNEAEAAKPSGDLALRNAGPAAGAPYDPSQQSQQPMRPSKRGGDIAQDPFSLGSAAFRARNYAEASKQFDQAAQGGDVNAALWAAEATREGQGCAVALGRFEQVAQKASGTWAGNEALLRAARCQMAMGQLEPARDRLNKLAQTSTHQQSAQTALAELNQVAAKRSGGSAGGGPVAAPRAAPRAASPARELEQKKAVDKASNVGF